MSFPKKLTGLVAAALAIAASASESHATVLTIDDFHTATNSFTQSGTGTSSSGPVMGMGILGSRTMSVTLPAGSTLSQGGGSAGPGNGNTAQFGFVGSYLSPNSGVSVDLLESFASTDVLGLGLTRLDFNIGSTLGVSVTITANGTSTYSLTDPIHTGGYEHSIDLSSFSDPTVFSNLTSLDFKITFPSSGFSAPSVGFDGPIFAASPIPEPSSMILSMVGIGAFLIGKSRIGKRPEADV